MLIFFWESWDGEKPFTCILQVKWSGRQLSCLSLVPISRNQECIYSWASQGKRDGKGNAKNIELKLELILRNLQAERGIITRFYFSQCPSFTSLVTISLLPVLFSLSVLLYNFCLLRSLHFFQWAVSNDFKWKNIQNIMTMYFLIKNLNRTYFMFPGTCIKIESN